MRRYLGLARSSSPPSPLPPPRSRRSSTRPKNSSGWRTTPNPSRPWISCSRRARSRETRRRAPSSRPGSPSTGAPVSQASGAPTRRGSTSTVFLSYDPNPTLDPSRLSEESHRGRRRGAQGPREGSRSRRRLRTRRRTLLFARPSARRDRHVRRVLPGVQVRPAGVRRRRRKLGRRPGSLPADVRAARGLLAALVARRALRVHR